ncbi:MAG: hypothetical protein ACE5JP_18215, partial [Candidatus Bipolaricaulia bacterium]
MKGTTFSLVLVLVALIGLAGCTPVGSRVASTPAAPESEELAEEPVVSAAAAPESEELAEEPVVSAAA